MIKRNAIAALSLSAAALVALCVIYTGVCAWNWRVLRRLRRASSTVG